MHWLISNLLLSDLCYLVTLPAGLKKYYSANWTQAQLQTDGVAYLSLKVFILRIYDICHFFIFKQGLLSYKNTEPSEHFYGKHN